MELVSALTVLVFALSLNTGQAAQEQCELPTVENNGKPILYILSVLPYPDPRPSFDPAFEHAPDLVPAAYLAIDQINNRTDVLGDYHLELIESNGGCSIESEALVSFAKHVIHSGKNIAGIVGPGCSDSTVALSSLCGLNEVALITVHSANSAFLSNRTRFPYAIATSDISLGEVYSLLNLMTQNDWRKIAVLYDTATTVFLPLYLFLEDELAKQSGYDIVFSAAVFNPDTPLEELRGSFARIVVVMVGFESLCKLVCMAYSHEIFYPAYQLVFVGNYPECYYETVEFSVLGREYSCTGEQMETAIDRAVVIYSFIPFTNGSLMISGQSRYEYFETYFHYAQLYSNCRGYKVPFEDTPVYAYDAVWTLALALNNTVSELDRMNLTLMDYSYGHHNITDLILNEIYNLEFYGASGRVQYNPESGAREHLQGIYQFITSTEESSYTGLGGMVIGFHEDQEWNISSDAEFLPDDFESELVQVSIVAAVIILLLSAIQTLLVVAAQVLMIVYRNFHSIKASSPKLNQFVYVGCYLVLFTVLIYTITEIADLHQGPHTALCNLFVWCANLGFTLMLGTVCAKTWRLYHIFVVSTRYNVRPGKLITDWFLALIVLTLSAIDIVVCTVWSAVDPLHQEVDETLDQSNGVNVIKIEKSCKSSDNLEVVFVSILTVYKAVLMVCSVGLAFLTRRIHLKDFKTWNALCLIYLLTIFGSVGLPLFLITELQDVNVNIPYLILSLLLNGLVLLCLSLLFFPPLLPLLKAKYLLITEQPVAKAKVSVSKVSATNTTQIKHTAEH